MTLPSGQMGRLAKLYSNRIVNVNVNVVLAGILALGPTVLVVHLSRRFGVGDDDKKTITLITFVADLVSDVTIYFGLHWLANHSPGMRRLTQVNAAYKEMSFVRDAATVQLQRAILSPLLYAVAFGTIYLLLHAGWDREVASAVGLVCGIITTRILHTVWMIRLERKALETLRLIKPQMISAEAVVTDAKGEPEKPEPETGESRGIASEPVGVSAAARQ
ncbi:MAG: hypothetical protein IT435_12500 [Phycisphaerales bacterium]|nr:hypothetical protein [Phycisphaerales bacterium]